MGVIVVDDLSQLLADMANLLSIANSLRGLIGPPNATPGSGTLNGKLNGLSTQIAAVIATQTAQDTTLADIEGRLVDMTTGSGPGTVVNLPVIPPAGYGGASAGDAASAVWDYVLPYGPASAQDYLFEAGAWAGQESQPGWVRWDPFFARSASELNGTFTVPSWYPILDLGDLVEGESLLAMLTRQNPTASSIGWWDGTNGSVYLAGDSGDGLVQFVTTVQGPWLDAMQNFLYTPSSGPPERSTMGDTSLLLSLIPLQYG